MGPGTRLRVSPDKAMLYVRGPKADMRAAVEGMV
jgi:hypothetical protein